jgi:hypothetical protein
LFVTQPAVVSDVIATAAQSAVAAAA